MLLLDTSNSFANMFWVYSSTFVHPVDKLPYLSFFRYSLRSTYIFARSDGNILSLCNRFDLMTILAASVSVHLMIRTSASDSPLNFNASIRLWPLKISYFPPNPITRTRIGFNSPFSFISSASISIFLLSSTLNGCFEYGSVSDSFILTIGVCSNSSW